MHKMLTGLIVTTTIAKVFDFEVVVIVGEDIVLLVIHTGLTNSTHNNYLSKCGRGKMPDILYLITSITSDHHPIHSNYAFS